MTGLARIEQSRMMPKKGDDMVEFQASNAPGIADWNLWAIQFEAFGRVGGCVDEGAANHRPNE